jgi:pimeloyl-ACP methyl ester carboxylesterase
MAANSRTALDLLDDPLWAELDPAELEQVHVPVLLTSGDRSPAWLQAIAGAVGAHLPAVTMATLPSAGHVPQLTHADDLCRAVAEFLSPGPRTGQQSGFSRPGE